MLVFGIIFVSFFLFYFYCRLGLKLSVRQTIGHLHRFFWAFLGAAERSSSWEQLILIAYQTWLNHNYPAGTALRESAPSPEQIEQAGLLLQALVAAELKRPDLPEAVRRGHEEILKIAPQELGYSVRDLILEQFHARR